MALNVSLSFPGPQATGFDVEHLELREAMSELSELVLLVLSTDPAIDMTTLVGQPVMVALADEPLLPQLVLLVRRARQLTSEPTGASRYELTAVPPLWLTTRRTDHRARTRVAKRAAVSQTAPDARRRRIQGRPRVSTRRGGAVLVRRSPARALRARRRRARLPRRPARSRARGSMARSTR